MGKTISRHILVSIEYSSNMADTELPKEDAPKEDATKEDATKGDATKEDAPKEDATKEDAPKEDATKEDATKEDAPKEDAPKEDAPKEVATEAAKEAHISNRSIEPVLSKKHGQTVDMEAKGEKYTALPKEKQTEKITKKETKLKRLMDKLAVIEADSATFIKTTTDAYKTKIGKLTQKLTVLKSK